MLNFASKSQIARSLCGTRNLASSIDSRILKKYPIGSKINGYTVERVLPVPEFNLTAIDLTHDSTGSKHLHIDRQDTNNVFSIIFKTNPPNSTGLPHILEHTTLCGSEKYPVRDPFFKMLNRSLSNFMNAMTGHDYTFYPFATTNIKDFDNLMNIYLDATMHPLLTSQDFYQEGWRLEHEITKDKESPLIFKGVVYNEMKGQVSDSSYYFWIKFQESIYPSLKNSGGDPTKMTDLVYEDLVDFHSSIYHPSNSRTFTYGTLPLEEHLNKINKVFITFGKRRTKNITREPIELNENKSIEVSGPIDPMLPPEQQYKTSLTWYTGKPSDIYETFLMKIVSTLLMDGHSSPLYQKLIETGLGTDFSLNSGAESLTAVNLFTVGLSGLTKENSEKLQDIVLQSLNDAKKDGFPDQKIKAIIHQLELSRKVESASFGLNLLSSLVPGWVNNVDPMESLKWDEIVSRFNKDYKEQGDKVLIDILEKYVLKGYFFKYTMKPDEKLPNLIAAEETERLETKISKLSEDDKKIIYDRSLELLEKQEEKEDLSCLPTVHVSDIAREGSFTRISTKSVRNVPIQTRLSPKTNGLAYFKALKSIGSDELDKDLIKYLPLFTSALTNLGTKNKSMADLEDEIKLYTGGMSANVFTHASPFDTSEAYLKFGISSVCLNTNFEKMLTLWQQLLLETDFRNIAKLRTLVKSLTSDNLSDIVSSGHSYAKSYAVSKLSTVGSIQELLGGIENVQFLSELGKIEAEGLLEEKVVPKLEKIRDILLNGSGFKFGLTTSREAISSHESDLMKFNNAFTAFKPYELSPYNLANHLTQANYHNFIQIPSQVSFASSALHGSAYNSKDAASLQILSQLLTFKYLHGEIREKGGAYGGGASFDALNGMFSYYSYRDPKPFESIKQFGKSIDVTTNRIREGEINDVDLDQAKLTIFQRIDAPKSVREEGMTLFNYEIDDDLKQERRENLLDCDLEDILEMNEKYFGDRCFRSDVIIGHSKDKEEIGELKENWKITELN